MATENEAEQYAATLLSFFNINDVGNPAIFAEGLIEVMQHFPVPVLAAVVHPLNGLPGKLKFRLSIADVVQACNAENARLVAEDVERRRAHLPPPDRARPMTPEENEAMGKRVEALAEEIRRSLADKALVFGMKQ